MNTQPTWQRAPVGYYVDPITLRDAQFAQSKATKFGVVGPFRIEHHSDMVPDCPQPDYPIRERAYTADQLEELATRQRDVFADRFAAITGNSDD